MRERLDGWPYDVKKEEGKIVIRFYPKGEVLKYPDKPKFTLHLSKDELKKLTKSG